MLRLEVPDDEGDKGDRQRNVDNVSAGERDRLAAHTAGEFQERDHRAGEGDGADGDAERHFDQALAVNGVLGADIESSGGVERSGCDQHRRHADQRVEGSDEFRH